MADISPATRYSKRLRETSLLSSATQTLSPESGGMSSLCSSRIVQASTTPVMSAQQSFYQVERSVEIDGTPYRITASIGVAVYPDNGNDVSTLLGHADEAMYRAKAMGGNWCE